MSHISENRRARGSTYYTTDDPNVVVQVATEIREVDVKRLRRKLRDHKKAYDAIKVPVLPPDHPTLPREIQKIYEEAQCRAEDERNMHRSSGRKIKKLLQEIEGD